MSRLRLPGLSNARAMRNASAAPRQPLSDRGELYNGFGNSLAVAFEFVMTPAIMGAIGFGLDSLFGTRPALTIVLLVLGFVGMSLKLWYGYDYNMKLKDADSAWAKARAAQAERQEQAADAR